MQWESCSNLLLRGLIFWHDYRRFGLHASRERNAAGESRSKMTPTSTVFPVGTGAEGWTEDDSFQSLVLRGLTTREVL